MLIEGSGAKPPRDEILAFFCNDEFENEKVNEQGGIQNQCEKVAGYNSNAFERNLFQT